MTGLHRQDEKYFPPPPPPPFASNPLSIPLPFPPPSPLLDYISPPSPSLFLCLSLTDEGEDDGEERRGGEGERRVEFQHLQQLHDEDEDLVLRIPQQHRDGHRLQLQFR